MRCIILVGVGLSHISQVRKVMGKILAIDQNNYPEMLGKTCIINAPGLFKTVFALVKPMLDPRTLSKIEARFVVAFMIAFDIFVKSKSSVSVNSLSKAP